MESISLDSTDLQLLNLLQTDAAQSNQSLAEQVHVSPPTCLRRVKRMHDAGLIERQVAILQPDRLSAIQGHGLACIVEVSLDRQGAEPLDAFEARTAADETKKTYRKLARKYPPDVSKEPDAVARVTALTEANAGLSAPENLAADY